MAPRWLPLDRLALYVVVKLMNWLHEVSIQYVGGFLPHCTEHNSVMATITCIVQHHGRRLRSEMQGSNIWPQITCPDFSQAHLLPTVSTCSTCIGMSIRTQSLTMLSVTVSLNTRHNTRQHYSHLCGFQSSDDWQKIMGSGRKKWQQISIGCN
jgi:hypothetical protein